ncbi:MAG: sulfotransferase domain-containing protein [Rhodospirillaceae bacterium]|nr:sulfotransferase domain-containing protein [Rhodospirillaceae bacterium]MCA8930878.1 sulfotransferase domain-containing protein [Rhodospirillaceae bacterium]
MPIVWLASYPKSGNTWVRSFIANYLMGTDRPVHINDITHFTFGEHQAEYYEHLSGKAFDTLTDDDINRLRPAVQRYIDRQRKEAVFVKTHSAVTELDGVPTILGEVTIGALYIIRNPLDVCVSYAHHMGVDYDTAVVALGSPETQLATHGRFAFQVLGGWSDHVVSWVDQKKALMGITRYEDLSRRPEEAFTKVVRALKMPVDKARLRQAIKNANFKTLRSMENKSGFIEASKKAERFFRKGKVGDWRTELNADQIARIVADHRTMMCRFGYLDSKGTPVDGGPAKDVL